MARSIYLAVFSNGARPAHYSVFVPTSNVEEREYQLIPLAQVDEKYVAARPISDGQLTTDTIACDRLESAATVVSPPGPSTSPFDSSAPNCQGWIRDYVQKLVDEGYVGSDTVSVIQNAPKRI